MSKRWLRVKEICGEILELPIESRPRAMEMACSGDEELLSEVQRVLWGYEDGNSRAWDPMFRADPDVREQYLFEAGDRVAGLYDVIQPLGRGGMGEVYAAEGPGGRVAIKVVRGERLSGGRMQERLIREGKLAGRVVHENVCRVFEVLEHRLTTDERIAVLVMERLEGITLREHLRERGRLEEGEAMGIAEGLAAALDAAHAAGVIHRDFKTSNIMLTPSGRVVVTDFGLAIAAPEWRRDETTLTSTGTAAGTPEYMSPEHLRGQELSARSDLYSFGVVLFEMLAGRRPGEGTDEEKPRGLDEILRRCTEPPEALRGVRPEASKGWDRALRRALDPEPMRRFASAGELLNAVRQPDRRPLWRGMAALAVAGMGLFLFSYFDTPKAGFKLGVASPAGIGPATKEVEFLWSAALGQARHYVRVPVKDRREAELAGCAYFARLSASTEEVEVKLDRLTGTPRSWQRSIPLKSARQLREPLQAAANLVRAWTGDSELNSPLYQRSLREITTSSDEALRFYLAGEAIGGKNRTLAVEELTKAVEFDPKFALAHVRLGDLLAGLFDYQRSAQHYEEALAAVREGRASYCEALRIQGLFAIDMADYQAAQASLGEAVRSCAPDPALHFYLGGAARNLGRPGEAKREWEEGRRLGPEKSYFMSALARLAFEAGDMDEVERWASELERNGHAGQALRLRGIAAQGRGRTTEAQSLFRRICESGDLQLRSFGCSLWGHSLAEAGRYQDARAVLVAGAEQDERAHAPEAASAKRLGAAWLAFAAGERGRAVQETYQAIEKHSDPFFLSQSAVVLRFLDQGTALATILNRLRPMARYPRFASAMRRIEAAQAEGRGEHGRALELLLEAARLEPSGRERVTLARAHWLAGQRERYAQLIAERESGHWIDPVTSLPGYARVVREMMDRKERGK